MATIAYITQQMQNALTTGDSPLFATNTCFYAFDPTATLNYPPNDQYAVIQPSSLKVHDRVFKTGNQTIRFLLRCEVVLWVFVRLATDEAVQDSLYLQDSLNGSLVLIDNIITLFQSFTAIDPTTTNRFGYELEEIVWQTEKREGKGWGATQLRFHSDVMNH